MKDRPEMVFDESSKTGVAGMSDTRSRGQFGGEGDTEKRIEYDSNMLVMH